MTNTNDRRREAEKWAAEFTRAELRGDKARALYCMTKRHEILVGQPNRDKQMHDQTDDLPLLRWREGR